MADHQRHRDRIEKRAQLVQDIGLESDHHLPACRQPPRRPHAAARRTPATTRKR